MHQTAPKAKAVLAQALIGRHLYGVERFFTRGGLISPDVGSLRHIGERGWYWSSTASTSASNAYDLFFYVVGTHPSESRTRWYGLVIRCVAAVITFRIF